MNSTAVHTEPSQAALYFGEVKARHENRYIVLTDLGSLRAKRASGCLLEPRIGDRVLLAAADATQAYILNVLERSQPNQTAVLSAGGDLAWRIPGRLEIRAGSVDLEGSEKVSLNTPELTLNTMTARTRFLEWHFLGGLLEGRVDRGRALFRHLDLSAERLVQKIKRSYRQVEEFEQSRIGRLRYIIRDLFSISSKNTNIQSEKHVNIDAEKINLG